MCIRVVVIVSKKVCTVQVTPGRAQVTALQRRRPVPKRSESLFLSDKLKFFEQQSRTDAVDSAALAVNGLEFVLLCLGKMGAGKYFAGEHQTEHSFEN